MKLNKIFAFAIAALTLASCGDPNENGELKLDPTSATLKLGETLTIKATGATVDKWESDNVSIATVEDGVVTGVKEGTAIITAIAGEQYKTCVVKVVKSSQQQGGGKEIKASQIWPIVMDGVTYEANESKVVASFQPNDVDQFLYVWEETYAGGEAPGMNSMGNAEGYTSLVVTAAGWSGMGYNLNEGCATMEACRQLRDDILADPDQYYLHMAIKSTDNASHTFYFMNTDKTKFVFGTPFDGGTSIGNFTRNGAWHEYDIAMADYVTALATADLSKGCNIFCALSGGVQGTVLNLDAVYFYKK